MLQPAFVTQHSRPLSITLMACLSSLYLDDFASKLPPWAPELPNHLYALVDMGSNGIRFSISDLSPPGSRLLKCLYRERAAISLFDALNELPSSGSPEFPSGVIAQVSQTMTRFKSIADDFGVPLSICLCSQPRL
ncbi:hypothetical protein F5Y19DRAFT_80065 [Xylariaceae sp. FL1651]|nr:hypothetical protein F5Y19DRAFT_80065 [Xylariaceae sp. FL1651]